MIKPKILTHHPLAYQSHDHLFPKGTLLDNTKNGEYVRNLIRMRGEDMSYLDLGCAGGGFVSQFLERDVLAVGIDGSDYSRVHERAEWPIWPDYFFTADITKPFLFLDGKEILKFDVISAFDVLEHLPEDGLRVLGTNLSSSLKKGGLFVASIATFEDEHYHVTLHEEDWWVDLFGQFGLTKTEPLEVFGRNSSIDIVFQKD